MIIHPSTDTTLLSFGVALLAGAVRECLVSYVCRLNNELHFKLSNQKMMHVARSKCFKIPVIFGRDR